MLVSTFAIKNRDEIGLIFMPDLVKDAIEDGD
jgi:hypothetical protein